jgi:shikimate 5-dehydrogenase
MKYNTGMSNRVCAFRQMLGAQNTLERLLFGCIVAHNMDWIGIEWALQEQRDAMRKLYFDMKREDL